MRTFSVLLLIDTSRVAGQKLMQGIIKYKRLFGHWEIYNDMAFFGNKQPFYYDWKTLKLDGAIVHFPDERLIKKIFESNISTIVRGFKNENALTIRLGVDHLLGCGFYHLAFCGYINVQFSHERQDAFETFALEAGCQIYVYQSPLSIKMHSWQQEKKSLAKWIRSLPKPIGVMCANDDLGKQVLETCKNLGILVPDEVGGEKC